MILCSLLFLAILLLCPSAALAGSKYGATLWMTELLPTLLPFFIAIRLFQQSLPRIASRQATLLLGLLCGYPTGAALVSYQYQQGLLARHKAYFYLGFVNNPSPMFILSFCGNYILHLSYFSSILLFLITMIANCVGSIIFSLLYKRYQRKTSLPIPLSQSFLPKKTPGFSQCIDDCILQSFVLITKVGGYVILFSILGQILGQWISMDTVTGILSLGMLEITSGISYLKLAVFPHIVKEVLTVILLSFGGLSAIAQTNSVLTSSGLSILPYVLNRLLNAILAGGISLLILCFLP